VPYVNHDNAYFFVFNPAQEAIIPDPVPPQAGQILACQRFADTARIFPLQQSVMQKS
jgi:hypothetical protein